MFMLRRLLKRVRYSFDLKEFTSGVKEAVKVVSVCIGQCDSEDKLQLFLDPPLHRQFKSFFQRLNLEKKNIFLNLHSIGNIHISGARFVIGNADAGDEEIFYMLGQKIILSKNEIEEFEEEHGEDGMKAGFIYGKQFGEDALRRKVRFQLDVKFQTKERLAIYKSQDENNSTLKNHLDLCYHKWKFESPIKATSAEDFELDWTIVDIDDYLRNKFRIEESNES